MTPRTPAEFLTPPTPKGTPPSSSRLDANAPAFIPSRSLPSQPSLNGDQSDRDLIALKARTLSSLEVMDTDRESPDTDNPALQYARLRLKHEEATSARNVGIQTDADEVRELVKRLDALKNSYFFDEKEAETFYQAERGRAHASVLQDQLRGVARLAIPAPKPRPSKSLPNPYPEKSTPPVDIFDDDCDDATTAGIFEILDDMPSTETDARGVTIVVRDMAMPKHWSGRTPKMLLKETVAKSDRYAAITYRVISGVSRAKRAAVSIRWEGKKMDEWLMEDVACHDVGQAEQYIATIALHALTFSATEGFAASVPAVPGGQTSFRLLPAMFRDMWDELEVERRLKDDRINRDVWAKLISLLKSKAEGSSKVGFMVFKSSVSPNDMQPSGKSTQLALGTRNSTAPLSSIPNTDVASEQLVIGFRTRQGTTSYQEMLVSRCDDHQPSCVNSSTGSTQSSTNCAISGGDHPKIRAITSACTKR